MAGYIKGITIEFGADTTKLNNALGKTQTALNKTQTELKQIDRALKFNPRNTTLLNQKFDLLKTSVTQSEKKLAELKNLQAQMTANNVDKNSAAYRELEREIIKTEDKLKDAQNELKKFGSVGKQQCIALGEEFKKVGSKISSAGQTMTMRVTTPLVAGFTASAKYASDLEENMNKLDVAFGDNAEAVKAWAKTAGEKFGMSQVAATDAASSFGALGKGIGLSEEESANMSTTLAGLSADLGSYFNVGLDESSKALEGIFTGESEALKKFGVVMTDTNLKQFAEDQGLVYNELTQTEKTQLRYNYVLAKTKDAQGDFSRTSDGTANSIKIFQASIQDLASTVGAVLLPIITPIIQKISSLVQKFGELSPTTQKVITVIAMIVAAIGPLLVVIGGLISAVGTIITIAPTVGAAFTALLGPIGIVIAAVAAAIVIGIKLYKNWDTVKAKAISIWNAIKNAIMKPVNAVKNAVKKNFTTLKSTVTSVFTSIKTKATSIWNGIKSAITSPIETAKNTVKKAINKIKGFFPLSVGKIFSNLKIPHISVSGGKAPFGIGGLGTKPKISVSWNKKAMGNPYLFSNATLFGAGEAGDEVLYGRSALMRDIAAASGGGIDYGLLAASIVDALSSVDGNVELYVDGKKMAQAQAPYMNIAINQVQARQARTFGIVGV